MAHIMVMESCGIIKKMKLICKRVFLGMVGLNKEKKYIKMEQSMKVHLNDKYS